MYCVELDTEKFVTVGIVINSYNRFFRNKLVLCFHKI